MLIGPFIKQNNCFINMLVALVSWVHFLCLLFLQLSNNIKKESPKICGLSKNYIYCQYRISWTKNLFKQWRHHYVNTSDTFSTFIESLPKCSMRNHENWFFFKWSSLLVRMLSKMILILLSSIRYQSVAL